MEHLQVIILYVPVLRRGQIKLRPGLLFIQTVRVGYSSYYTNKSATITVALLTQNDEAKSCSSESHTQTVRFDHKPQILPSPLFVYLIKR